MVMVLGMGKRTWLVSGLGRALEAARRVSMARVVANFILISCCWMMKWMRWGLDECERMERG
jgi:hypothetical protein